jgi:hypothetical protein
MANSPSHKFGQMIGDVLEATISPLLREFANKHKLYLDQRGPRPARSGDKLSWVDKNGNTHDLDFVLEKGGSSDSIGAPIAFIETAWRRYTKHSRNKAQEIQGAIVPLSETYSKNSPFMGAVLAGVFTEGALNQLKSLNFQVLYFPYEMVVSAFQKAGIDASFDEGTPDEDFVTKLEAWQALPKKKRDLVPVVLLALNHTEVAAFINKLEKCATRLVKQVRIFPLHGNMVTIDSIDDAISFVEKYNDKSGTSYACVRYEVLITYSNGDEIKANFQEKENVLKFLADYRC